MYKCPKCGKSESFLMQAELTIPDILIDINGDGKINDIEEYALRNINIKQIHYEVISFMICNSCGYEAPEDEFEGDYENDE